MSDEAPDGAVGGGGVTVDATGAGVGSGAEASARGRGAGDSEPVGDVTYSQYKDETQLAALIKLIEVDLSEPYSIYTYRFFIHGWPQLCYLAHDGDEIVGVIVCKAEVHKRSELMRGYIAMLAVDARYRKRGIGTMLVALAINKMKETCGEVVLETELANTAALKLYAKLGFVRDKLMRRYYLNGGDAYRLKVWFQ